jgi:hypothetical protein
VLLLLACSETRLLPVGDEVPEPVSDPPADTVPDVVTVASGLVLNEVQTANDSTVMDTDLAFRD